MQKFKSIPLIIKNGHSVLLLKEIFRRMYSNEFQYGLRRDLNVEVEVPKPKISIKLRLIQEDDIPTLLNLSEKGISSQEFWERLFRFMQILRIEML